MADTYVAEPNTVLLGSMVIEILQAAGLPPDRAGPKRVTERISSGPGWRPG